MDIGGEIRSSEDFDDAAEECFLTIQILEMLIDILPAFGLRKLDKPLGQYGKYPIVFSELLVGIAFDEIEE